MRIVAIVAAAALIAAGPAAKPTISVAYAASLTRTMEGPIKAAFEQETGYGYEGEGKGSKALANMIVGGLRNPDVFLSADASLYPGLRPFARADLVLAYAPSSRYAKQLDAVAAGTQPLVPVLKDPGLRLGRTDPAVDPKGQKSLAALAALGVAPGGPEQVFPEEDLLARVETGQLDAGFFYTTETHVSGIRVVPLPQGIGSRPGIAVIYAIEALSRAPHPDGARAFVDFILTGSGRKLLQDAGVTYL
jgi:molybdate/tungstate transport system substrate-binding protein